MLLSGTTVLVKVAPVRLCHSRMLFARAYPRETQAMVRNRAGPAQACQYPMMAIGRWSTSSTRC